MATFRAVVTYSFDTEFEFEADSYDTAENLANDLSTEWLPYSAQKGYTDFWNNIDCEIYLEDGELEEDEEDE
jgi:hypothetical protein